MSYRAAIFSSTLVGIGLLTASIAVADAPTPSAHADIDPVELELDLGTASDNETAPNPTLSCEPPLAEELAFNPNIGFESCTGGLQSLSLNPTMGQRTYTGTFYGATYGYDMFGDYCTGYFQQEAQFCVTVRTAGTYDLHVTDGDNIDTTLALIGTDDGSMVCDDDGGYGLLSRLNRYIEAGTYLLYVGSYSQGNGGSFQIDVAAVR